MVPKHWVLELLKKCYVYMACKQCCYLENSHVDLSFRPENLEYSKYLSPSKTDTNVSILITTF